MKAKLEINEQAIKEALKLYFKNLECSDVTFKVTRNTDYRGEFTNNTINAIVTIEVGDPVAQ